MSLAVPPPVTVVIDRHDDAIHTHTALAAHHLPSGRITLHPGPGTTSETGLAHDLLAALDKPPMLPGRFPAGRQPAWEAAAAWMTALAVNRLTVLRAHRLTARRTMRLLQLHALTGIHLTLVCHRPHLPAALHQSLRTTDYSLTADFETARRHYYGTPVTEPPPADEPAGPAGQCLTLPALDRLVSYDSPRPCVDPCTPPLIAWRHRPPPVPLTARTAQRVAHRLHAATAHPRLAAAVATALFTGASLQQLATARPRDYDDTAATLALHDRARYTDGCATYPVPPLGRHLLTGCGLLHPARIRRRPGTARRARGPCAPAARGGDGQAAPAPAAQSPPQRPGRPCGVGLARAARSREIRSDTGQAR
jgi:hypothetical protein